MSRTKTVFDRIIKVEAENTSYQADWDRQRNSAQAVLVGFAEGYDTILLADEVGMGKTYVALCVMAEHILRRRNNDRKIILITPPSSVLRAKWEQEIRSFDEKYILSPSPDRSLRPMKVDGYWDLVQNLHDYDNEHDIGRIHSHKIINFVNCLFEWGALKKVSRRMRRTAQGEFVEETPDFLSFRSKYSIQAMYAYFDKINATQDRRLFTLIDELKKNKASDSEVKKLFRDFAANQDHYEANVFIIGMNALKRPKSNMRENQIFSSFVLGLLLARTWETTREEILEKLETTNIILRRRPRERREKYYSRILSLSNGDYYGLKEVVRGTVNSGDDVKGRWERLKSNILKGDTKGVGEFFKDLAAQVFQAKLKQAGIDLAVVDEVHNWKNGNLGAQDFRKNFSPFINRKLIMSATPFQIQENELKALFGFVQKPGGGTEQTLKRIYEVDSLVSGCLKASERFRKAWADISRDKKGRALFDTCFENIEHLGVETWLADAENTPSAEDSLREFASAMKNYRLSVNNLTAELGNIIIRHTKCRDKRHFHIGSKYSLQCLPSTPQYKTLYQTTGYCSEDDAFVNFIAMRLYQLIRRDSGKGYEANAKLLGGITSSTSAFHESSAKLDKEIRLSTGTKAYRDLFNRVLESHTHPKVMATAERAFQNYREGKKTLIFCERLATLEEIAGELETRIERYLNEDGTPFGMKRESVLKNQFFVDNLWWWSLLEALGCDHHVEWKRFTEQHIYDAARFAGQHIQKSGLKPSPRRIILLLDLYLIHTAINGPGLPNVGEVKNAVWLFLHQLSSPDLITSLIAGDKLKSKEIIEDVDEDESESEIDTVARQYSQATSNLWVGQGAQETHRRIWQLLESEALTLLDSDSKDATGHKNQISSSFVDIMADLIRGLRRISLRPDLLSRYGAFSKANDSLGRIREGFRSMPVGDGTMVLRTTQFLKALIESNGTINQQDKQTSKRRSLWQGVFLRKDGYVETLSSKVKSDTRVTLCAAFNSPLAPDILVCTSIGSEGIDLHRNCAEIIHHDLPWNPAKLEQRIGRVDRVGSFAELTKNILIHIGIPFLAHNYEQFQYDVVHSRAQKFEVLMGRPEYSMVDVDEEIYSDSEDSEVNETQERADIGEVQVLTPLPEAVLDYLKIDLSLKY